MLQFLCHPNSLPPVGEHRDPKMTAVIKKSAFVVTLRLDLFDCSSGTDPLRNPTATSLARKNEGKWNLAYSKLQKEKRLAALKTLAVAHAKAQPACSDDDDDDVDDFSLVQKPKGATKEILDDLAVEVVAREPEAEEDGEGDDADEDKPAASEDDDDSTTSSSSTKRQKKEGVLQLLNKKAPPAKSFFQAQLPFAESSSPSARPNPSTFLRVPSEADEKSPTQGSKKRKKKHDDSDTGIVGAGLGADSMQPIRWTHWMPGGAFGARNTSWAATPSRQT